MKRSEAGPAVGLEPYLSRLEVALSGLTAADRREILLETRSHVLERTSRGSSGDVVAVLAELGPPEEYARQFLPEEEPAPPSPRGPLDAVARLAAGRWTALPLLFAMAFAYGIAAAVFLLAVWKLVEPHATGLFVSHQAGRRSVLLVVSEPHAPGHDVLGYWLVPIALLVSVTIHLAMSALSRRLLRNDARRA